MTEQELAFTVIHARATIAETLAVFLAKKLFAITSDVTPEQVAALPGLTAAALEEAAQFVEADLLRPRDVQKYSVEERALLADEFRAILEEMKRKIGG